MGPGNEWDWKKEGTRGRGKGGRGDEVEGEDGDENRGVWGVFVIVIVI